MRSSPHNDFHFIPTKQTDINQLVYGHFGPKTLRTRDMISALVPKCLEHFGTTYISYTEMSD